MNIEKKILVPIGFSEQSLIALQQAYLIAKQINASITILKVIEDTSYFSKILLTKSNEKNLRKQIESELNILATNGRLKYNLSVDIMIAKGKVYTKILEVSEMIGANIIVMGSNGFSEGLVKNIMGTNALNVVRLAQCPVITVRGTVLKEVFSKIFLPLDLTKETKQKVSFAIEFAKLFKSKIYLFSVLITNDKDIEEKLKKQLSIAEEKIANENVEYYSELLINKNSDSKLFEEILQYGEKVGGDLLIIMTQQENFITDYIIGSAAQSIINYSNIPVMSITPKHKSKKTKN